MKTTEKELRKERFADYETAMEHAISMQRDMTQQGYMTSSTMCIKPAMCSVTVHHARKEELPNIDSYQATTLFRHEWYNSDSNTECTATTYYFETEE